MPSFMIVLQITSTIHMCCVFHLFMVRVHSARKTACTLPILLHLAGTCSSKKHQKNCISGGERGHGTPGGRKKCVL